MSYIIKTFTKSEYEITDEQEENIRKLDINDNININGSTIKASNIAEIIKVKDNISGKEAFIAPPLKIFKKSDAIRAIEQMIVGLNKHINSTKESPCMTSGIKTWYQGTSKPIKLRELMERKLQEAINKSEEETFENPLNYIK